MKVTTLLFVGLPVIVSTSFLMFTLQSPFIFIAQLKFTSLIFSLFSGVYWGFNLKDFKPDDQESISIARLILGFLPILVSFGSLIVDPMLSFLLLSFGLISMIPLNYHWSKLGLLPKWFGIYFLSIAFISFFSLIFSFWSYVRYYKLQAIKKNLQEEITE